MLRLLMILCLFALPAQAEMPAGHDEPAYQAAVEAWLDGADEALADLYALAGQGNVAALIMHRRMPKWNLEIDWKPLDPFWLDYAENSRLGLAFGIRWDDGPELSKADKVAEFLRLGEPRHAANLIRQELSFDGWKDPRNATPYDLIKRVERSGLDLPNRLLLFAFSRFVLDDSEYFESISDLCRAGREPDAGFDPLVYFCDAIDEGNGERISDIFAALVVGRHTEDPFGNGADVVNAWLLRDRSLPYYKICKQVCARGIGDCVQSAYARSSKLIGFVQNGSPVETLVPQSLYHSSKRHTRELWHKLLRKRKFFLKFGWPVEDIDMPVCLARALDNGVRPWEQD